MQDFKRIVAWQKARTLVLDISRLRIPPRGAPGLRSQLFRAAEAISAHIAEGSGRDSRVDFARFLSMAISTTSETEHHLYSAFQHGFLGQVEHDALAARAIEIRRMLFGLRRAILQKEADERGLVRRGSSAWN